jgi:hypothetical protein
VKEITIRITNQDESSVGKPDTAISAFDTMMGNGRIGVDREVEGRKAGIIK